MPCVVLCITRINIQKVLVIIIHIRNLAIIAQSTNYIIKVVLLASTIVNSEIVNSEIASHLQYFKHVLFIF